MRLFPTGVTTGKPVIAATRPTCHSSVTLRMPGGSGFACCRALGALMAIRLVIIDGHTLCRHGLAGIVAGNGNEIGGGAATLARSWIPDGVPAPPVAFAAVAVP